MYICSCDNAIFVPKGKRKLTERDHQADRGRLFNLPSDRNLAILMSKQSQVAQREKLEANTNCNETPIDNINL